MRESRGFPRFRRKTGLLHMSVLPATTEIEFETQYDANAAVERLNEVLKKATGIVFAKGPFT